MPITRVWVEPGCVRCMQSVESCPEVFQLGPEGAVVKPGADPAAHEAAVRRAAGGCPVSVIRFEEA